MSRGFPHKDHVEELSIIHFLFAKKTAANTKATEEKAEHVQITTVHRFR